MNISWGMLDQWARGKRKMPAGWTLEYEFRPSLMWYPNLHAVHAYWKWQNPDKQEGLFWHLEKEQRDKVEQAYLQSKYRHFTGRAHGDCSWQRFTLTDINGKQIILQMDSSGHVNELKAVSRTETYTALEVVG